MPKRETVLITGGAGFIGSHLCDRLIAEGFKVICLDNFITGSAKNIKHLRLNPGFIFKKQDSANPISIRGRVDFCLHFASPASPKDYLKFPIQTLEAGSLGAQSVLELAKKKKARFLLASTSEVYGDPLEHPQTEKYRGNVNCTGARSCYDEAKRFAEALTMAYHREHKLNTGIVRIFNTYGPRMRINDGRVVPNFIYQALNNEPLTVYGEGKQTRSFCYVDDLVEGIYRLMLSKEHYPVNLGNPDEFTILKLAELLIEITGAKSRIVFRPLPQDDPRQRRPDIGKAEKLLNWSPVVGLKEGLRRTIKRLKNIDKAAFLYNI